MKTVYQSRIDVKTWYYFVTSIFHTSQAEHILNLRYKESFNRMLTECGYRPGRRSVRRCVLPTRTLETSCGGGRWYLTT